MLLWRKKEVNILFVCTGNTCRSPMAEGYLQYLITTNKQVNFFVDSAGIFAKEGEKISKYAKIVLQKYDYSDKEHSAKNINQRLMGKFDLILTMTEKQKKILLEEYPEYQDKIFILNKYAAGKKEDIPDPYGGSLVDYETVFLLIKRNIDEIYKKLTQ